MSKYDFLGFFISGFLVGFGLALIICVNTTIFQTSGYMWNNIEPETQVVKYLWDTRENYEGRC